MELQDIRALTEGIRTEIGKVVVGQDDVVDLMLTSLLVNGHVLLSDEINRAPPKTQAALLQAMNERVVTIDGHDYPLGDDFMVVATQNPIEQQGTYPLPEAQLDRFL